VPAPMKTRARVKTRWGDKEARRKDILDAARQLIELRGYQAFNMRDVARGAGVTVGTVYTYFTDKEALFAVLYAERLERFHADIAPLCGAPGSAEELFVAIANRYLAVYQVFGRELNVWTLLVAGASAKAPPIRPLVEAAAAILLTVRDALDRVAARRGRRLDDHDRRLAVPLLWATLQGLCDQFTGARHLLHPHGWEELTRYAGRTLARAVALEEDD